MYYARLKRNGKDSWKSLRTTNRAKAKAELAKLERKAEQQPRSAHAGKPPTLAELIKTVLKKYRQRRDYKSYPTIENRLRNIARTPLGARPVNRITSDQIEFTLLNLKSRHYRDQAEGGAKDPYILNSTRNRYVVELRMVFREAKAWQLGNPCDGVDRFPERPEERVVPTPDELEAVGRRAEVFALGDTDQSVTRSRIVAIGSNMEPHELDRLFESCQVRTDGNRITPGLHYNEE